MSLILVVEDDYDLREAVEETLTLNGFSCITAENGQQALELLDKNSVNLMLTDVQMPVLDGFALLEKAKAKFPGLPVLLMTAYGAIDKAVLAIKNGAIDYLTKPFDSRVLIEKIKKQMTPSLSSLPLQKGNKGPVIEDEKTKQIYSLASKVAKANSSVLIYGESGTGKEVLARFIHQQSPRKDKPFIALNCAAIPDNMLEALLFGYEKGAFTGAYQASAGKFEQANGGTLLLDEISEMPLSLQAKILRVLQEREVERLGGKRTIKLDVRILATTNRDLKKEVQDGNFREDLFYRLNVFPLTLAPLRARKADILPIARLFIHKYADRSLHLDEGAQNKLLNHVWPGNIRQLENVVQRALVLCEGGVVKACDLMLDDDSGTTSVPDPVPEADSGALGEDLKQRESELILSTLKNFNGSRKETADKLGISTRTLRYKLARMRDSGIMIEE